MSCDTPRTVAIYITGLLEYLKSSRLFGVPLSAGYLCRIVNGKGKVLELPVTTGGKEIGYCAVPDPKRRQENNGEFINHIIVSLLLRIKLNLNEGYAD